MSHKEGAEGALGQERGALLRRDVLTAAHAAVNLKVQGFAFLLGSKRETEKRGEKCIHTHTKREQGAPVPTPPPPRSGLGALSIPLSLSSSRVSVLFLTSNPSLMLALPH